MIFTKQIVHKTTIPKERYTIFKFQAINKINLDKTFDYEKRN